MAAVVIAIGNVMIQAKTIGLYSDIQSMRNSINDSIDLIEFYPEEKEEWNNYYKRYLAVTNK